MEKQNPSLFCSYLTYSIKTSPKLFFCNRCVVSLPWVAPHLHSLSCSELEASEGEDDVQERTRQILKLPSSSSSIICAENQRQSCNHCSFCGCSLSAVLQAALAEQSHGC